MARKQENILTETLGVVKTLWRNRPGNQTIGVILDTFDNLGFITKDERKPLLTAKRKAEYGWHLIFKLPPGISFKSILAKREYFQDASNSWIVMEWRGGRLHMDIQTGCLPETASYDFDYMDYPKMSLPVPVGVTQKGIEVLDLAEAPHLLVAGVPGFGKSNFLHVLIHSILPFSKVAVIDLKRLEFAYLADHCLVTRTVDDARELLKRLNAEMEKRIDILEAAEVVKIQQYKGEMPFYTIVVDEVAELQDDECIYLLDRIVRLARAVGISVVCATQRPSTKVINGDTRAMFAARLCYQVADELNSRMVLGESCPLAAYLPAIKGRAIYKFGITEKEVQTMYLPIEKARRMLGVVKNEVEQPKHTSKRLLPR